MKRLFLPAGLGVGLWILAAASAQTSRPGDAPTTPPMMPRGPWGGMSAPGGGDAGGLGDVKKRLLASDEEWRVIGPKLRKVMAARQAAGAAIDPTNPGGGPAGGFAGRPGFPGGPRQGPGGGFRPPDGPGFGGDSFSGPGGGGPGGPGGGPGSFGRPRGPTSGPANDFRAMGGPAMTQPPGAGASPRDRMWPGATTQPATGGPATTRPAGGFAPMAGDFGPQPGGDFGPRSGGGFGPSPGGGFGPQPGGGFGPQPGGGFGPQPGGGFGPPPGFGGRGGAVMQAMGDLQTALADAKTTPEQIKEKVAAVRAARQKVRAELEAAQKDLLELLTSDQEAVLVSLGVLD